MDPVAHPGGIGIRIGRLGVPVLDELVVLRTQDGQLSHATFAIKNTKLEMLVADQSRTVRTSLDANTGPAIQLVGDLIDERSRMGHGLIVSIGPPTQSSSRVECVASRGLMAIIRVDGSRGVARTY